MTNKKILKWIGKLAFYTVALGLFVYSGSRSLDFIQATLPANNQLIGWLGLLASAGGAVSWLLVHMYVSQGTTQRGLSLVMTGVDLLGEFTLFTIDTLLRSGEAGLVMTLTPEAVKGVVIAMSALVAVNIGATFWYHLADPEMSKQFREETAKDTLDEQVLRAIETKAPQLAEAMAPQLVSEWERDFVDKYSTLSSFSPNGHQPRERVTVPKATRAGD